ncbi:50S ribosomal protein L25/general stress protein Ctc [Brasilonema bromeliae]|uniref:Large ribosomal subunit protein bL25 n=1 Tax=Brasilonema bromeliae SPC951 TaxID=385972 RepID=A0ABX1P846_9CYAN|nr:50S ribosomal protein L25/general stress protein Ctc [Brasilonema bromeliae]NMG20479.1 50S ribosomal protein L25 [Brasilonema bromeliae SPC951]
MQLTVDCQKRPEGTKPNALRRSGKIPAHLYGHKGTEAISLVLDAKVVERLLIKASVNNTLIDLNITDVPWRGKTLLREVQSHPAKRTTYHLSFFAVAGHGDTDVEVPVNFVGEPVGVKLEDGVLDTQITVVSLRCAPENIPEAISVDVSNLHVGDSLYVDALNLPANVTYLGDSEQAIVRILPRQVNAEAEAEAEAAAAAESEPATSEQA